MTENGLLSPKRRGFSAMVAWWHPCYSGQSWWEIKLVDGPDNTFIRQPEFTQKVPKIPHANMQNSLLKSKVKNEVEHGICQNDG